MALIAGEAVRFNLLMYDGRYFQKKTNYGFTLAAQVPVLLEHDTAGYQCRHLASLLRGADGILLLHNLDETLPQERELLERIAARTIFLSPGTVPPGQHNAALAQPRIMHSAPYALRHFPIREISYTRTPAQEYLQPCEILFL